jgi:hypothetical protein
MVPGVRIPSPPPIKQGVSEQAESPYERGVTGAVCTSVCTPLDEATLLAAIARLTAALTTVDDAMIPELVRERAAMRTELDALRSKAAPGNVVPIWQEKR